MEYTFKVKKTGKIVSHDIKISEYDDFKKAHPELERYHDTPPSLLHDAQSVRGFNSGTSEGWKEVLSKVADSHPASPLAQERSRKSIKEVKTRQIIDKHVKKAQKAGRI